MKKAPLRVLLVEDAYLIRQRLKAILQQMPEVPDILEAGDYDTALAICRQHSPRCMVLDIRLPGKSGIELLRTIAREGISMTIIVLTNETDPYYKRQCMQLGAHHFLDKSKDFEKVPALLLS